MDGLSAARPRPSPTLASTGHRGSRSQSRLGMGCSPAGVRSLAQLIRSLCVCFFPFSFLSFFFFPSRNIWVTAQLDERYHAPSAQRTPCVGSLQKLTILRTKVPGKSFHTHTHTLKPSHSLPGPNCTQLFFVIYLNDDVPPLSEKHKRTLASPQPGFPSSNLNKMALLINGRNRKCILDGPCREKKKTKG